MTREEILAMKPGRGLDALVYALLHNSTVPREGENRYAMMPRYSRNDAAALEIIPAMAKRGWDCAVCYDAASEQWSAHFLPDSGGQPVVDAESNALAEAVCKAALLALLEEGEDA